MAKWMRLKSVISDVMLASAAPPRGATSANVGKDYRQIFCCVINKCQTRRSDKLEKCVRGVVLLYLMCRNLYRTKSIQEQHLFFVFN